VLQLYGCASFGVHDWIVEDVEFSESLSLSYHCGKMWNVFDLAENSPACKQTGVPPDLFGTSYPAPWHEDLREVNSHPLHWPRLLQQLL